MRTTFKLLTLLGGGVAAPGAPSVSSAATSTSNIRTTITNISPTATTLKIYRSTDNVSFSLIDTVAVTGTSQNYDDGTITAGTNYYYKVGANNAAGEGLSAASSKVNTLTWGWRDLHYYKFDETSGTRADSIGSTSLTANGTGGVPSTTGILGNAPLFDSASNRYLSAADSAAISIGATSFEMCFWVNSSASLAGSIEIVSKRNEYICLIGAGKADIVTWHGGVIKNASKSWTWSTNTTYFISMGFDSSGQINSIDVNNSGTRGTLSTGSNSVDDGIGTLAFGGRISVGYMSGWLDEVFFGIGRMLTAAERTALYNSGAGFNGFLP